MRLLRSWPAQVPAGRAYVHDDIERLVIDNYDYRVLGDFDDDVLLLEWDIAVGKEDLAAFAARARLAAERVLVAPYRLYHYASDRDRATPLWAHRRYEGDPQTGQLIHVREGDPTCHLWGLGMTYLPRDVIRQFLDAWPGTLSDGALSGWHYQHIAREVPITWDIRPVHLHYLIPPIT
ncbi:hypothetical protein [Streptomyces sp. NPDC048386]|uniref:hypothetical protein n=1 Tax=Streptomyces sp. NPDC048386 TaxID=3365541 RepID=UPI003715CCAE